MLGNIAYTVSLLRCEDPECWACKDLYSWDMYRLPDDYSSVTGVEIPGDSWIVGGRALSIADRVIMNRTTESGDIDYLYPSTSPYISNLAPEPEYDVRENKVDQTYDGFYGVKSVVRENKVNPVKYPEHDKFCGVDVRTNKVDHITAKVCRVKIILNYDLSCLHVFLNRNVILVRRLVDTLVNRNCKILRPLNYKILGPEYKNERNLSDRISKYEGRGFKLTEYKPISKDAVRILNIINSVWGHILNTESTRQIMSMDYVAFYIAVYGPIRLKELAYNSKPTYL